jgi:hypothetical protein
MHIRFVFLNGMQLFKGILEEAILAEISGQLSENVQD